MGTAHGHQSGRLFGAPATRRPYRVNMFDYVRVFGPLIVVVLVAAAVLLLAAGVLIGALAL